MNRRDFLALTALATAPRGLCAAEAPLTALVGGTLVTGEDAAPIADSVVLLDGERIRAVGTLGMIDIPSGASRVSTEGCTLLPGLWDMNVHLSRLGHADRARWDELYLPLASRVVMPLAMAQLLRAGVTTVRDVAAPLEASLAMRERISARTARGPAMYVSGPALVPANGAYGRAYRLPIAGAGDARARTTELVRAGVDFIVVGSAYGFDAGELAAIVATAHAGQVAVHAEIVHDEDLVPALNAGVDGLIGIGDGGTAWSEAVQSAIKARLAAGGPLVLASTLSPLVNYAWLKTNNEPLDEAGWREGWPPVVADDVRSSLDDAPALAAQYPNVEARRVAIRARIGYALDAGVLVVAGSGAGDAAHLPGRATWQEVEALVREAGLSPHEAIRRATYWPAVACGEQHQCGTVTVGKYADLLCVRGDALRHIDRLADVEFVYRHGMRLR